MSRSSPASPHSVFPPSALSARTIGSGELVVCLHSSTGTQGQWQYLAERLSSRWQVLCPDLHGHGRSPAWPQAAMNTLHVDAHAVTALIESTRPDVDRRGVHLVGHSYGGAVALQIALRHPGRVRSLTLYEPVAFGLLREMAPRDPSLLEITDVSHTVRSLLHRGELDAAAAAFVGYWAGGPAGWAQLPAAQRDAIVRRVPVVPRHFDALFTARWHKALLARVSTLPILLMHGSQTRTPARRVADLLAHALPHMQRHEVAGAGHLGPMTHERLVGDTMAQRIDPTRARGLDRVALAA